MQKAYGKAVAQIAQHKVIVSVIGLPSYEWLVAAALPACCQYELLFAHYSAHVPDPCPSDWACKLVSQAVLSVTC